MISTYNTLIIESIEIIKGNKESFASFSEKVKDKYKLVLFSNEGVEPEIAMLFRLVITPENTGCEIPSLAFFDKALEIIAVRPGECIFVGLTAKSLHSAEEVGMSPILLENGSQRFGGVSVIDFGELLDLLDIRIK